jgi:hypothetical protein
MKEKRRKLSRELIDRADELARLGLGLTSIAQGLGVHRSTLREWLAAGAGPDASRLEATLSAVMQEARCEGEQALIASLHTAANGGNINAATWLLTHSPRWRSTWSDAANLRREVAKVVGGFVKALLEEESLTQDQRERVLLNLRAQGLEIEEPGEDALE